MPICPYFVSGKCNYGNKCYNLHVNIGTNIQTTAKASVTGRQWILSCFAPFEGETLLPDFIEDQSFEEVRLEYYQARATNSTHLAEQNFNQRCAQAYHKMNRLVAMEPAVQNYLVDVFGAHGNRNVAFPGGGGGPVAANPFGSAAAIQPAPATQSIFGGGSGNSVFGGGQQNTNPFGQSAGSSPFQLGQITANQSTSGGFGSSMQQPQSSGNIFGQPQQAAQPIQSQPPASIFGQAVQQNQMQQQSAGNIFGQPTTQSSQLPAGGSIFSQNVFGSASVTAQPAPQQNSVFGQPQPPSNPFQNASPFGQPPNSQPPAFGNVFNNPQAAHQAPTQSSTSVFGVQPVQQQQQQMQSVDSAATGTAMYSEVHKLSQEHLSAFQANEFTLGQIPNVAPPKELCF